MQQESETPMTNEGNAIDWIREKFFGQPKVPVFGPPSAYVRPTPLPIAQPTSAPLVPTEQPSASLVSTRDHARGRAEGASLVGGR